MVLSASRTSTQRAFRTGVAPLLRLQHHHLTSQRIFLDRTLRTETLGDAPQHAAGAAIGSHSRHVRCCYGRKKHRRSGWPEKPQKDTATIAPFSFLLAELPAQTHPLGRSGRPQPAWTCVLEGVSCGLPSPHPRLYDGRRFWRCVASSPASATSFAAPRRKVRYDDHPLASASGGCAARASTSEANRSASASAEKPQWISAISATRTIAVGKSPPGACSRMS